MKNSNLLIVSRIKCKKRLNLALKIGYNCLEIGYDFFETLRIESQSRLYNFFRNVTKAFSGLLKVLYRIDLQVINGVVAYVG